MNIELNPEKQKELHDKISKEITQRAMFSHDFLISSGRIDRWRDADRRFRMYEPKKTREKASDNLNAEKKDKLQNLIVPYDYALLLTAFTYLTSVFLSRDVIFQLEGRHGEAEMNRQAMESSLEYQVRQSQSLPALYLWILDACRYGVGYIGNQWIDKQRAIARYEEVQVMQDGVAVEGKTKKERTVTRQSIFKGTEMFNIRPHDARPDPRVPSWRLQEGEFFGWVSEISRADLRRRGASGDFMNVAEALATARKKSSGETSYWATAVDERDGRESQKMESSSPSSTFTEGGFVDLLHMVVEIIPKQWGLGEETFPEKWLFVLANNEIIVQARPMDADHCMFPVAAIEWEFDGYASSGRGISEIIDPLSSVMEWMFNTHIFNIRKVLNNSIVADPSRVVMKDLTGEGGGVIRLKPTAYGTSAGEAVKQLQVGDYTQAHVRDTEVIISLMQKVLGLNDNLMGQVNPGGRKSATEVRTSSSASANRVKTVAEIMSATGFNPLTQMLVANTQQYFTGEEKVKLAGGIAEIGVQASYIDVTPDNIAGSFDFLPVDGTMPIDRFAQANLFKEVLMEAVQMPMIAQRYDMAKIFGFTLRLMGVKNLQQFEIQAPAQIQQGLANGTIQPVTEGNPNGGTATDTGSIPGTEGDLGATA